MKKLSALFLALCLLLSFAFAEDVSSMTDAELKALYVAVKEELMARKLWDTAVLPAGVYVGGMNLPEGSYELTLRGDGFIIAYKDYDTFVSAGTNDESAFIFFDYLSEGTKFTLTLTNNTCWALYMDATVSPFAGLSW